MMLFQDTDDETELLSDELSEEMEKVPMSMGDPITAAAAMLVMDSWYNFYVKGNEATGIFVGLWAPTLLGASGYLQQKELYAKLKEGFSFGR